MWRLLLRLSLGIVLLLAAGTVGLLAYVYSGIYDVAATRQHTAPVYWLLTTARRQSIWAHAALEAPQPPDLEDADLVAAGQVLYDQHCVTCHGAPGVAPGATGLGMMPSPPNLTVAGRDRSPGEIYWAVTNGIKMSGMPAWEFRMTERERWAVVAFLKTLPLLTPSAYEARRAASHALGSARQPIEGNTGSPVGLAADSAPQVTQIPPDSSH
jgi:mono/diheme cytochrome c family protein